ncbi:uncharacterized protein LOC100176899 [Ciona intestinalis]
MASQFTTEGLGDIPDKWFSMLQSCLNLQNGEEKNNLLKQIFMTANRSLTAEKHKTSESYAKILAEEAAFVGSTNVNKGRNMFKHAVYICRTIPFIHLTYAQFEVRNGHFDKALNVLEFGKMVTGCKLLFEQAISKLQSGYVKFNSNLSIDLNQPTPLKNITNTECNEKVTECQKRSFTDTALKTPPSYRFRALDTKYYDIKTPSPPMLKMSPTNTFPNRFTFNMPTSISKSSVTNFTPTPASATKTTGLTKGPQRVLRSLKSSLENADSDKDHDNGTQQTPYSLKHHPLVSNVEPQIPDSPKPPVIIDPLPINPPTPIIPLKKEILPHPSKQTPQPKLTPNPPKNLGTPNPEMGQNPSKSTPIKTDTPNLNHTSMPPPKKFPPQRVPCTKPAEKQNDFQTWFTPNSAICINNKHYLVIKELGEGGSSKVLQVFCAETKSILALKKVSLKDCDESTKNEFTNEIEFLLKLRNNSHIVHLYDFELTPDFIHLVMECGSTDLAKLLHSHKTQNSRLEVYEIIYFWKKMLLAVQTIHKHGVIHRDLKPANFLLVKGNLKLIDFGISNAINADATSVIKETQCGTLNYMAPEAILDMSGGHNPNTPKFKISPMADVWSLGCILYSMLYGCTPFQHIKHQLLKLNAITNHQHRIEFPAFKDENFVNIVQECLKRNPKHRPTVDQLLQFS